MKTFRSVAVRIALYGGLMVLAATVWAWAVGANPWHGVAAGGVLGLGTGIFLGLSLRDEYDGGGLQTVGLLLAGLFFIGLLLALSLAGAIVGIVRLVFLN